MDEIAIENYYFFILFLDYKFKIKCVKQLETKFKVEDLPKLCRLVRLERDEDVKTYKNMLK